MKRKKAPASKRTMNLVFKEKKINLLVLFPSLLLIAALAALLGKFAVADRLAGVEAARREVEQLQTQIRQLEEAYQDYDEVEREYHRYTYKGYDQTLQDRKDVLALLEEEVLPVCSLQSLAVSGRQLNITVGGLTLEGVSRLLDRLEESGLVESVEVPSFTAMDERTIAESLQVIIALQEAKTGGKD